MVISIFEHCRRAPARHCRSLVGLACGFFALAWSIGGRAATPEIYGQTTGWLRLSAERDPFGGKNAEMQAPFYHFLMLGARNLGVEGLSAEVSGLWGVQLRDPVGRNVDVATGDLLYANMSYDGFQHRLFVRVGRQHVFTGAAFGAIIDGLHVAGRPVAWLDLSAFVGATADRRFTYDRQGLQFGGRIAYGPWDVGQIGLSYVEERADAVTGIGSTSPAGWTAEQLARLKSAADFALVRRDIGLDASLRVWRPVTLLGRVVLDAAALDVQEGQFSIAADLPRGFGLMTDYAYVWPDGRIPKYSIFWIFSADRHHRAGAELTWQGDGLLSADASGHLLNFAADGFGYDLHARGRVRFRRDRADSVALEIQRLAEPDNAYTLVRVSGHYQPVVDRLRLSADVGNYFYDESIHGYERSHLFYLAADVRIVDRLVFNAGFETTINPQFDYAMAGLFKIVWDLQHDFGPHER